MTDRKPRKFTGKQGVRTAVPLWLGIYGTSGSGKTYSALRLANGIQSVTGGKIAVGDTESGRALHYASEFDFLHYPFDPPFEPLAYKDLVEQMAADGATVAIIDSASHEHEGPGGVLEMHDVECERLAKAWNTSLEAVNSSGWIKPKRDRLRMIDGTKRTRMHIIWCFRAQRKMNFKAKKPTERGYMPIGGEVLVYEMAVNALLLPGSKGVPMWQPREPGEKEMVKLPHWAERMLRGGHPLDEELGARLARWAQGTDTDTPEERQAQENEQRQMDKAARAEFRRLYETLTEQERAGLGIGKAIKSIDELPNLDLDRVQRGIAIMQAFVNKQQKASP